nr:uncharacterized protein CTRU02_02347 [Colletotrichum truncatum]KAF6798373.1 hypothetical protein CTRU02_02347 [Colletotrichum truncatum]
MDLPTQEERVEWAISQRQLSKRGAYNLVHRDIWGPREKSMANPWSPSNPMGTVILRLAENSLLHHEVAEFIKNQIHVLPANHLTYSTGPRGSLRLRRALSSFMNEEFHPRREVTSDNLFITPGLASGLDAIAWSICDEGEGILIPQPFYNGFSFDLLNRSNTRVVGVSYEGVEGCTGLDDLFRPEVNRRALESALFRARRAGVTVRALLISKCYPPETLVEFASFCSRNGLHFLSDEIYAKSVFPNPAITGHASFVSVLSLDLHDVISSDLLHVLYGASKDFCANGLRLGMVYTRNEAILGAMSSISMFSWSPHVLQDVWAAMLENRAWLARFMDKKNKLMVENYKVATSFLQRHNIKYFEMNAGLFIWVDLRHLYIPKSSYQQPSYTMLKVTSENASVSRQRELNIIETFLKHGIMISPGSAYVRKKANRSSSKRPQRAVSSLAERQHMPSLCEASAAEAGRRIAGSKHTEDNPSVTPLRQNAQGEESIFPSPLLRPHIGPIQSEIGRVEPNSQPHRAVDTTNLAYIVEVVHRPKDGVTEPLRVHYPIPASIVDQSATAFGSKAAGEPISLQEALKTPAPEVSDQLVRAFFEIIHVAYPVFDRQKFTHSYLHGQVSPLVLQTIFFLGFTVVGESTIQASGFSDRAAARRTYYRHAKALYDADYGTDIMNVVAVLLLFGFWWAGHDEQKDTCHWVGCATTFAQSLGMHRSTSQSALTPQMKSLRKRIWWAIYTRDRHTSAAFGRPCRIRDEDCDIEPLTKDDFMFDRNYEERLIPAQQEFHISYVMEMSRLAALFGDVLVAEFSPRRAAEERFDTKVLKSNLLQWESQLPNCLRMSSLDGLLGAPFWASMLHFNYQYFQILLFRPKSIEILSPEDVERDKRARMAADAITRNAEDQLAAETIRSGQIHLVPALFGALSIHTIVICRQDPVRRQLAENKSRQCLLALGELSQSWPVRIWISKSFVSLMTRLTGQGSSASDRAIVNVSSSIRTTTPEDTSIDGSQSASGIPSSGQVVANSVGIDNFEPQGFQGYDGLSQATDQLFYDNFWTSYLDTAFDVDLLIHPTTGSPQ